LKYLRRYWAPIFIVTMVAVHAVIMIGVRNRISKLSQVESNAVTIGRLRFQNIHEPQWTYEFQLHAILDPGKRRYGEETLKRSRLEIIESAEQMLRQVDAAWLADPDHKEIRTQLMDVVLKYLDEPGVQRVVVTDWLRLSARLPPPTSA